MTTRVRWIVLALVLVAIVALIVWWRKRAVPRATAATSPASSTPAPTAAALAPVHVPDVSNVPVPGDVSAVTAAEAL